MMSFNTICEELKVLAKKEENGSCSDSHLRLMEILKLHGITSKRDIRRYGRIYQSFCEILHDRLLTRQEASLQKELIDMDTKERSK